MYRQKIPSSIIYSLFIFAAILIYSSLTSMDMSLGALYSLFLGDFSIGVCSRFLIGEILSIFKDSFTREWMTSFLQISTVSVFLLTACYLGNALSSAEKTNKRPLIMFLFLFIATPASASVYAGEFFAYADVFLLAIFLVTAFFCESKILIFTLPVILASGVLVHDSYILAYMAPCLGILAYYVIKKYKKKLWASLVFVISAISCATTSVYSVFFAVRTVKMTEQEMLEYLAAKGNDTIGGVSGYLETFIFYTDTVSISDKQHADNIFELLKYMILYACQGKTAYHWINLICILPVLFLALYVWTKCIKSSTGFFEKLPYVLFMLTLLPQILSTMISGDFIRFLAPMVLTQIIYIFVCAKQHDKALTSALTKLNTKMFCLVPVFLLLFLVNMN